VFALTEATTPSARRRRSSREGKKGRTENPSSTLGITTTRHRLALARNYSASPDFAERGHILRGNPGHESKKEFFNDAISAMAGRFLLWSKLLGTPVKVRLPLCVSSLSKLRAALRSRPFLKSSAGLTGPPLAGTVAPPWECARRRKRIRWG
jgi:hypothetical protein